MGSEYRGVCLVLARHLGHIWQQLQLENIHWLLVCVLSMCVCVCVHVWRVRRDERERESVCVCE